MAATIATAETQERISWSAFLRNAPVVVSSLRAIGVAVAESGLEPDLIELVKIRCSQINGCAFCVQFHLNDARKLKVSGPKLDLVSTWRDAGIYTPRETVALEYAEALTRQSQHHVTDTLFSTVSEHFSEREIVALTAAIGQINFWNRIAATFRFTPPIPEAAV